VTVTVIQAHRLCTKAEIHNVTSTRATSRQNWLSKVREIFCSLCLIKESYYKRNNSTKISALHWFFQCPHLQNSEQFMQCVTIQ
jgi:hypothetical protein